MVEFIPKLVEMAEKFDSKTAARIKNNILTNTKTHAAKKEIEKYILPAIQEDVFEQTLNSSQRWDKMQMENFNSEMDLNSDHPSVCQKEAAKRLFKGLPTHKVPQAS